MASPRRVPSSMPPEAEYELSVAFVWQRPRQSITGCSLASFDQRLANVSAAESRWFAH